MTVHTDTLRAPPPPPGAALIAPEALRPQVEGDFANERVKQAIKAALFGEPAAPVKIGRFTVIRELGRGGTGVVYAAYDEQLERKIAVKLLHSETSELQARARLLREAQAMARLSHPNIVSVHEVGTHQEQVYIAMEFVHGVTLSTWLKKQPRTWREIVEVFRQAGSGLAAAHEAGLVHRDFKPANAMLGDDGRVRVLDFGLARADDDPAPFADLDRTRDSNNDLRALDASLTVTGVLLGTPAYMAPEQFRGESADARSDQFALCVALYEALYRERPFAGDTLAELMQSVLGGKLREPSSAGGAPRGLRSAILRGLRREPELRWPTLAALLQAIDRVVEPRRRPWLLAAGFAGALASGWGLAYQTGNSATPCEACETELAEVWSHERAAEIAATIAADPAAPPHAAEAWARAAERFDDYARRWTEGYADACAATELRREQSQALYALRRACLEDRRRALSSALDLLSRPDPVIATRAADIARGLPSLDTCADALQLQSQAGPPADPALAGRVADLRAELARAEAYGRAGKLSDALRGLEALALKLPEDYPPLRAELELARGRLLATAGESKDAVVALQEAYYTALSAAYDRLAIAAAIELVHLFGRRLADFDAAELWVRHARALLQAHSSDPAQRAALAAAQGHLAYSMGHYAETERHFERALNLYEEAGAAESPEVANVRRMLADASIAQGRLDEAEQQLAEVRAQLEREYGEHHPDLAAVYNSAGTIALRRNDPDAALRAFEAGRAAIAGVVGQDSHVYVVLSGNIAAARMRRGETERAEQELRGALATFARAMEALPSDVTPLHPDFYMLRATLVVMMIERDDLDGAEAEARALLAVGEQAWGPNEPYLSKSLGLLSRLALLRGEPVLALSLSERAYRLVEARGDNLAPMLRADATYNLARALADNGDPRRARTLGEQALALARKGGDARKAEDIRKWLAQQRLG